MKTHTNYKLNNRESVRMVKHILFLLIITIFLSINCINRGGTEKIEGMWVFTTASYTPIEDENYHDYKAIIIENENIYLGYLKSIENPDFNWIYSNTYNIKEYSLKPTYFDILYSGSNKKEKYSFVFQKDNTASCVIKKIMPDKSKTEFIRHLIKVDDYENKGKLTKQIPQPDLIDISTPNNTIESSHYLKHKGQNIPLSFHFEDDVDWFKFTAIYDFTYNFITNTYSLDRNTTTVTDTAIELYAYNEKNELDLLLKSDNDNPMARLLWRCSKEGDYYLKIYPKKSNNKVSLGTYNFNFMTEHILTDDSHYKRTIPFTNKTITY